MPRLAYLEVAQVSRPHGVRGELKARPWTDEPGHLEGVKAVYIKLNGEYVPFAVESCRSRPEGIYWKLSGIDTPEKVEKYRGQMVCVKREDAAPLEEGAHYIAEMEGCQVIDEQGTPIGVLEQVFRTGSNDVYSIRRPDGSECLLPAIRDVVKAVDIDEGIIRVDVSWVMEVEDVTP
nr:ribosome maturation factor RimM [bacterium]